MAPPRIIVPSSFISSHSTARSTRTTATSGNQVYFGSKTK
jgi:hypothetical protein